METDIEKGQEGRFDSIPFEGFTGRYRVTSEKDEEGSKDISPTDAYERAGRFQTLMAQGLKEGKWKMFHDSRVVSRVHVRICWPYYKDISHWNHGEDSWLHKLIFHRGIIDGYVRKLIERGTYP